MKIVPLGTSSGTPTKERNVSSVTVFINGAWLLFDCGEGTQYRLLRSPLRFGQLEAVFVTHMHGDHIYGLPGLLGTLSLQHRTTPLHIFGPRGIRDFLTWVMKLSYLRLGYELKISEVEEGEVYKSDGFKVVCKPLEHRVTDFGYLIVEDDKPGRFDLERAKELGIPAGPLYRQLQLGSDITLPDGRLIKSSEVVGEKRKGKRVAYCTDTRPCMNAVELSRGATMLIHEATYTEDLADEARLRGHSTAAQAASIAEQAGVERLLITHFSPRYLDIRPLLEEARRIFPNTDAARDLLEIELK
ncbi:MAG: ribonuclease Z [Blastocatellia bacterium]|nr:ribonuclease Z [Blastocatellia bacterium]